MGIETFSYQIKSDLKNIHSLQEYLAELGKNHHISSDIIFKINLSLEEMIVNIIQFNQKKEDDEIELKISLEDKKISLCLIDKGQYFNPMEFKTRSSPHLKNNHEEGLGVILSRSSVDEMSYRRKEGCNYLTLIKNLP